jgi:hypothetical protein
MAANELPPDPVPAPYLRGLLALGGLTQARAAGMLRVAPRTLRDWLEDGPRRRTCPWAMAELLRRMVADQQAVDAPADA